MLKTLANTADINEKENNIALDRRRLVWFLR